MKYANRKEFKFYQNAIDEIYESSRYYIKCKFEKVLKKFNPNKFVFHIDSYKGLLCIYNNIQIYELYIYKNKKQFKIDSKYFYYNNDNYIRIYYQNDYIFLRKKIYDIEIDYLIHDNLIIKESKDVQIIRDSTSKTIFYIDNKITKINNTYSELLLIYSYINNNIYILKNKTEYTYSDKEYIDPPYYCFLLNYKLFFFDVK